ncbi:MAG: rhodanese-like domain-containing protein [Stenotrophomonas sp.]|nr:rhodanese-like domain-containing protein [Stenotrophomonas sp.]
MNYEELLAFAGRNPMLSAALVGLTVAIIVTEIRRLFRGFKGIKPAELTQLINAGGTVVVDLSASGDFEKGHIAGSRNAQAANAKQSPVVLVCRSGNASETAAKALKKAGFEKVYVLDGGIPAWQQAELPLVKGRN